ncbi:MAG: hypothetical protein JO165_05220 [Candidatus Eremiobacteraeota bacterium]|nr:hypothetical protein [Candidatus Eremiobacteraeota bacterium]
MSESEHLYAQTAANERVIRESKRLAALQTAVDRDLSGVESKRFVTFTEELLQIVDSDAHHFGATAVGVEPASVPQPPAGAPDGLIGVPVTIRVQGKFEALLRLIEDLPRHNVLLAIDDTQMRIAGTATDARRSPTLEATIHATLYTVHLVAEEANAPAR